MAPPAKVRAVTLAERQKRCLDLRQGVPGTPGNERVLRLRSE